MDWERVARTEISPLRIAILEEFDNARGPVSAVTIAK
jgi:hypothetical protein